MNWVGLILVVVSVGAWANPMDSGYVGAVNSDVEFIESNDAGEVISVPDSGFSTPMDFIIRLKSFFNFKKNFETVTLKLTEAVEREFDVFIFANVSFQGYGPRDSWIPSQRMRILRKTHSDQRVFIRNSYGEITGAYDHILGTSPAKPALRGFPELLKISSGAGGRPADPQPYVDTFTGMFRMNHDKSESRRFQTGMYDSLYVDILYPWNQAASGIAIHGTPRSNNRLLGTQQSHGCVRINRKYSKPLYELAMSPSLYERDLMHFNRNHRLPDVQYRQDGSFNTRPGQKVLMIFFYGWGNQRGVQH